MATGLLRDLHFRRDVSQITLPTVQRIAAELRRKYMDRINFTDGQIIRLFQILATLKYVRYDHARPNRGGGTQSARLLIGPNSEKGYLKSKDPGQITIPKVHLMAAELGRKYGDNVKFSDEQVSRFFQILTTLKCCRYDRARRSRSGGMQSARLIIRRRGR